MHECTVAVDQQAVGHGFACDGALMGERAGGAPEHWSTAEAWAARWALCMAHGAHSRGDGGTRSRSRRGGVSSSSHAPAAWAAGQGMPSLLYAICYTTYDIFSSFFACHAPRAHQQHGPPAPDVRVGGRNGRHEQAEAAQKLLCEGRRLEQGQG